MCPRLWAAVPSRLVSICPLLFILLLCFFSGSASGAPLPKTIVDDIHESYSSSVLRVLDVLVTEEGQIDMDKKSELDKVALRTMLEMALKEARQTIINMDSPETDAGGSAPPRPASFRIYEYLTFLTVLYGAGAAIVSVGMVIFLRLAFKSQSGRQVAIICFSYSVGFFLLARRFSGDESYGLFKSILFCLSVLMLRATAWGLLVDVTPRAPPGTERLFGFFNIPDGVFVSPWYQRLTFQVNAAAVVFSSGIVYKYGDTWVFAIAILCGHRAARAISHYRIAASNSHLPSNLLVTRFKEAHRSIDTVVGGALCAAAVVVSRLPVSGDHVLWVAAFSASLLLPRLEHFFVRDRFKEDGIAQLAFVSFIGFLTWVGCTTRVAMVCWMCMLYLVRYSILVCQRLDGLDVTLLQATLTAAMLPLVFRSELEIPPILPVVSLAFYSTGGRGLRSISSIFRHGFLVVLLFVSEDADLQAVIRIGFAIAFCLSILRLHAPECFAMPSRSELRITLIAVADIIGLLVTTHLESSRPFFFGLVTDVSFLYCGFGLGLLSLIGCALAHTMINESPSIGRFMYLSYKHVTLAVLGMFGLHKGTSGAPFVIIALLGWLEFGSLRMWETHFRNRRSVRQAERESLDPSADAPVGGAGAARAGPGNNDSPAANENNGPSPPLAPAPGAGAHVAAGGHSEAATTPPRLLRQRLRHLTLSIIFNVALVALTSLFGPLLRVSLSGPWLMVLYLCAVGVSVGGLLLFKDTKRAEFHLVGIATGLLCMVSALFGAITMSILCGAIFLSYISYVTRSLFGDSLLFPLVLCTSGILMLGLGKVFQDNQGFIHEWVIHLLPSALRHLTTSKEDAAKLFARAPLRETALSLDSWLFTLFMETFDWLSSHLFSDARAYLAGRVFLFCGLYLWADAVMGHPWRAKNRGGTPVATVSNWEAQYVRDGEGNRIANGIQFIVRGTKPRDLQFTSCTLDFEGESFWQHATRMASRPVITVLRSLSLPLSLCPGMMDPSAICNNREDFEVTITLATGASGQRPGVSQALIRAMLKSLRRRGDPIMGFQFAYSAGGIFFNRERVPLMTFATRPSQILESLGEA